MAKASKSAKRSGRKSPSATASRTGSRKGAGGPKVLAPSVLVESMQQRFVGARDQASETWDNLELLFQTRVQRALQQLGIPSGDEIRLLARRVAELNDSVQELMSTSQRRAAAAGGAGKKKTAAKGAKRGKARGATGGKGSTRRQG
jgi:hypothetical protein